MLRPIGPSPPSYQFSDDAIKHNQTDISNSLTYINQLKSTKFIQTMSRYDESGNLYPINHNFNENELDQDGYPLDVESDIQAGFIVQDVSCINEFKFLIKEQGNDSYGNRLPFLLNYNNFHAYNVRAIQELHQLVLNLQTEVSTLKGEIETLKNS